MLKLNNRKKPKFKISKKNKSVLNKLSNYVFDGNVFLYKK